MEGFLSVPSSKKTSLPPATTKSTKPFATQPIRRVLVSSSSSRTTTPSSSPALKKRHWKVGEYPGFSETSIPRFSTSTDKKKRTPIKNIKKKLDKKENAKAWANTVTKALSEAIEKKQWMRALQLMHKFI